ncbi:MAG: hypothetical protein JL50_02345 [Peptococcaceae bacterium BICA1-7]|nr:MAG: hypothetical protein JL50_02345 [Peptococcaceae bacterium BICA1-7]HBV95468.1 hypothetical protein [Desulfotomaculum sp.]
MWNLQVVWEMMSDAKIWSLLGNIGRNIDEDVSRLMFIELFSRLKKLEEETIAMRILLIEENLLDKELYEAALRAVREFLKEKDIEKGMESDFFANSGIPFPEWVNFKLTGKFKAPGPAQDFQ